MYVRYAGKKYSERRNLYRTYHRSKHFLTYFSGLVKCADCGWSMGFCTNRANKLPYSYYYCSKYGQDTRQCFMHYIRYDVLYTYVLARVRY